MATLKDLSHPVWEEMVDAWIGSLPNTFDPPAVNVEGLVRLSAPKFVDKGDIEIINGIREATFADALFLRLKALNFIRGSSALLEAGHSTLTALTVYDACFFAAKSLIYLLGVRDVGSNQKWYLELFYFERRRKRLDVNGHKSFQLTSRLEHEILWQIVTRLINTTTGIAAGAGMLGSLKRNDYSSFSKERNALVYGAASWSRGASVQNSDLAVPLTYLANRDFLATRGRLDAEYVDKYLRTAQTFINIVDHFLTDIGKVASAVDTHVAQYPGPPAIVRVTF